MKWPIVVAAIRAVGLPLVAGLIAAQLVLAGLPAECAEAGKRLVLKL